MTSLTLGVSGSAPGMAVFVLDWSVPAFDPVQLMMLAEQAGETAAQRFLDDYLGLLPTRQERILTHLANGEVEEAMDAILSLKATSAMVGAVRVSSYCRHLQDELTQGNVDRVTEVAGDLAVLVPAFIRAVNGK